MKKSSPLAGEDTGGGCFWLRSQTWLSECRFYTPPTLTLPRKGEGKFVARSPLCPRQAGLLYSGVATLTGSTDVETTMKLYWSSRSPYVRKVMIAAHETGLADRLDCERTIVSAFAENADMLTVNPLGKIPTLVLDDGMVLYDSPVICEYLDGLHDGPKLFPPAGSARFTALRWLALGDGMLDMLLARMYEERTRTEEQRSQKLQDAIVVKLKTCLDALDGMAGELTATPVSIGHIAIACAIGYLDFRFASDNWRAGRPALAAWHKSFAARPSVVATEPEDVY